MTNISRDACQEVDEPNERHWVPACWSSQARSISGVIQFARDVRPWNWLELDATEAPKLWTFLSGFVSFFNHRYAERTDRQVPPCWAEHGPLVEELTTLAFARWHAFESEHASIGGAQYWHSFTLPAFYSRMEVWLGDDAMRCLQGNHVDTALDRTATGKWQKRTEFLAEVDAALRCPDRGTTQRLTVPFVKQIRVL